MGYVYESGSYRGTDAATAALFKHLQQQINRALDASDLKQKNPGLYQSLRLVEDGKLGDKTLNALTFLWPSVTKIVAAPIDRPSTKEQLAARAERLEPWLGDFANRAEGAPTTARGEAVPPAPPTPAPNPVNALTMTASSAAASASAALAPPARQPILQPGVPFYRQDWFLPLAIGVGGFVVIGLLWWGIRARFQHAKQIAPPA